MKRGLWCSFVLFSCRFGVGGAPLWLFLLATACLLIGWVFLPLVLLEVRADPLIGRLLDERGWSIAAIVIRAVPTAFAWVQIARALQSCYPDEYQQSD